jgi:Zn-dependent peptidase ImmA (M78 family)
VSTDRAYTIREVRTGLLGYQLAAVARHSGVDAVRLAEIEDQGAELTVFEADALGRVYGIDPEKLAETPITLAPGDGVEALALHEEFRDLADEVRYRVVQAANAARDLKRLREQAGATPAVGSLPRLAPERGTAAPFRQGGRHAQQLRTQERLGAAPIPSMRDFVAEHFPAITVLYAYLTSEGPAGVTFADRLRGPTIVLNLEGKNVNPCVRRFSLAHELYHVLADWNRKSPLAVLSGFLTDSSLAIEQRANGFAARLICPESRIRRIKNPASYERIRAELSGYGLHYRALQLYLDKEASVRLPPTPPPELVGIGTEPGWYQAEAPIGVGEFPLTAVPPERRTDVARVATHLHVTGKLTRRGLADALAVSPVEDLDLVLDFFGLERPSDDA